MGIRTNGQKAGKHDVGGEAAGNRPASTARRIASGGIHDPETAFQVVNGLAVDVLNGAIDARDSNAVCRSVGASIAVARNADLLQDMHERAAMANRQRAAEAAVEAEHARKQRVAALKAELAALEG